MGLKILGSNNRPIRGMTITEREREREINYRRLREFGGVWLRDDFLLELVLSVNFGENCLSFLFSSFISFFLFFFNRRRKVINPIGNLKYRIYVFFLAITFLIITLLKELRRSVRAPWIVLTVGISETLKGWKSIVQNESHRTGQD